MKKQSLNSTKIILTQGKLPNVFSRKGALRRHESEVHTDVNEQHNCTNCRKAFLREGNLKRHSQFCNASKKTSSGRRSLSVKNKKALIRILESENFTEESIDRAASKFKISSRQVQKVYKDRALLAVTKSGKRRREGGGRKLDDWWEQISPHVEETFRKYRQEYNLQVTTKHRHIWAQEACILKEIYLKRIAQEKGVKNLKAALM